jgi:hypothetical protein
MGVVTVDHVSRELPDPLLPYRLHGPALTALQSGGSLPDILGGTTEKGR